MAVLSEPDIVRALEALPGWRFHDEALQKSFEFRGFRAAIGFIDRVAEVAIAARHHPDLCNHYNVVDVALTTHAEGGVTLADVALAGDIEAVAEPADGA
jgi:4a-hydroxytetrahydrobiopterin dehydratase